MPSPKCPITLLADFLEQTPHMRGVKLIPGAKRRADAGSPRRINIFPAEGKGLAALRPESAIRDVNLDVVCRCWGKDYDEAWEVRRLLLMALEDQGQGSEDSFFWQFDSEAWEMSPDTSRQGEEVNVVVTQRCGIDRDASSEGLVESTRATGTFNSSAVTEALEDYMDQNVYLPAGENLPAHRAVYSDGGKLWLVDGSLDSVSRIAGVTPTFYPVGYQATAQHVGEMDGFVGLVAGEMWTDQTGALVTESGLIPDPSGNEWFSRSVAVVMSISKGTILFHAGVTRTVVSIGV